MKKLIESRSKLLKKSISKKQGIKECGKLLTLGEIYNYVNLSMNQSIISILSELITSKFALLIALSSFFLSTYFIVLNITMTKNLVWIVRSWLVYMKHFKEWFFMHEQELQLINNLKCSRGEGFYE